jgi:hypothetical protein
MVLIRQHPARVGEQRTVVLRAGTHFLAAPVVLAAGDSGVTFTNYGTEAPVVSGGVLLKPRWMPQHDTPVLEATSAQQAPLPPPTWQVFQDTDDVFGRALAGRSTAHVTFVGRFDDAKGCEQVVEAAANNYTSYTWSPPTAGAFARNCHAVGGGLPWDGSHKMKGFVSGRRSDAPNPPAPSPSYVTFRSICAIF